MVDVGGLQRLPAAFRAVIGEVGGDQVGMQLRIEFAAGVVMIGGDHQIAGAAVFIQAALFPNARPGQELHLGCHFRQRLRMGVAQPGIHQRLHRNRLGSRDGEVVQTARRTEPLAVFVEAVDILARAEEFTGRWMEALANGVELLQGHFTAELQQVRPPAHPLAADAFAFGVIVIGGQMPRGVGFPTR